MDLFTFLKKLMSLFSCCNIKLISFPGFTPSFLNLLESDNKFIAETIIIIVVIIIIIIIIIIIVIIIIIIIIITIIMTTTTTIIVIIDHVCQKTRFWGESISILFERLCLALLIRSDLISKPYQVIMFVFC